MAVIRPPQRDARRGHAAAGGGLQDPRLRRRQAAVRGRQRVGCRGGGADPLLQRAPRHFAATADGRHRARGAALARAGSILKTTRSEFEALLLEIAEHAEEWLTSAQAMGHTG